VIRLALLTEFIVLAAKHAMNQRCREANAAPAIMERTPQPSRSAGEANMGTMQIKGLAVPRGSARSYTKAADQARLARAAMERAVCANLPFRRNRR
jgi:hypothetical protein